MFRNLAIAIVSVCAVSTGSPAWSQNSPVEPTELPADRQYAASNFEGVQHACYVKRNANKHCYGEEARPLFNKLDWKSTTQIHADNGKWYFQRIHSDNYGKILCWARDDGGGDPVSSMIYECRIDDI
jgi:hypothetical protein